MESIKYVGGSASSLQLSTCNLSCFYEAHRAFQDGASSKVVPGMLEY
jgi:hypothetical protein